MNTITILGLCLGALIFATCNAGAAGDPALPASTPVPSPTAQPPAVIAEESPADDVRKEPPVRQPLNGTKGLITLAEKNEKGDFIKFYNADGSLWYQFTYYYDDSDGHFEYRNENFRPWAFHPDYFSLGVRCVGEDKKRFEVVVNEETGLRKFVKRDDPLLRFQTWGEYILGMFSVGNDPEKNPIMSEPGGGRKIPQPDIEGPLEPVEIKGDWLKVKWKDAAEKEFSGWIRWKEGDAIIIDYFSMA